MTEPSSSNSSSVLSRLARSLSVKRNIGFSSLKSPPATPVISSNDNPQPSTRPLHQRSGSSFNLSLFRSKNSTVSEATATATDRLQNLGSPIGGGFYQYAAGAWLSRSPAGSPSVVTAEPTEEPAGASKKKAEDAPAKVDEAIVTEADSNFLARKIQELVSSFPSFSSSKRDDSSKTFSPFGIPTPGASSAAGTARQSPDGSNATRTFEGRTVPLPDVITPGIPWDQSLSPLGDDLKKILSSPQIMNGELPGQDSRRNSVWDALDRMRSPRSLRVRIPDKGKEKEAVRGYDVYSNNGTDDASIMVCSPLLPNDRSLVEIAHAEVLPEDSPYLCRTGDRRNFRKSKELDVLDGIEEQVRETWPYRAWDETWKGDAIEEDNSEYLIDPDEVVVGPGGEVLEVLEGGASPSSGNKNGTAKGQTNRSRRRRVWVPSTTNLSLQALWWGYRLYLPPPVLDILNNKQLEAAKRAALLTGALAWLFDNLPSAIIPLPLQPALFILQQLTPYLGSVGGFIAWSWGTIKGYDKGFGVTLTATWLLPVVLIPGTWEENEWPAEMARNPGLSQEKRNAEAEPTAEVAPEGFAEGSIVEEHQANIPGSQAMHTDSGKPKQSPELLTEMLLKKRAESGSSVSSAASFMTAPQADEPEALPKSRREFERSWTCDIYAPPRNPIPGSSNSYSSSSATVHCYDLSAKQREIHLPPPQSDRNPGSRDNGSERSVQGEHTYDYKNTNQSSRTAKTRTKDRSIGQVLSDDRISEQQRTDSRQHNYGARPSYNTNMASSSSPSRSSRREKHDKYDIYQIPPDIQRSQSNNTTTSNSSRSRPRRSESDQPNRSYSRRQPERDERSRYANNHGPSEEPMSPGSRERLGSRRTAIYVDEDKGNRSRRR